MAGKLLESKGVADCKLDSLYLLEEVTGHDRMWFLLNGNDEMPEAELTKYNEYIELRAARIPLQHITGKQEFMGLEFRVSKDVLVPRQDTEILVEAAGKYVQGLKVLDMCTGSGCIAISLKKLYAPDKVTAVDISEAALGIARHNAMVNQTDIEFVQGNLFENVSIQESRFDVIVSNPPYIPTKVIEGLEEEVKSHEPMLALDGYEDGLYFYREIIKAAPGYLKKGGRLMFEIGHDQAEAVSGLLEAEGFTDISVLKDYAGLDRVVYAVLCI